MPQENKLDWLPGLPRCHRRDAYQGKEKVSNIILEAITNATLVKQHMDGTAPKLQHGLNLTDIIYLDGVLFMKTISDPSTLKQECFEEQQKSGQIDVEHGFGLLQVCFLFLFLLFFFFKQIIICLAFCQIFLTKHDGNSSSPFYC